MGQSASSDVSDSLAPSLSATPDSMASFSRENSTQEVRSGVPNAVATSVDDSSIFRSAVSVDSIADLAAAAALRSEAERRLGVPTRELQGGFTSTPKPSDLNANQPSVFAVYQKNSSGDLSRSASVSTPNRQKAFATSLNRMQPHTSAPYAGIGAKEPHRRAASSDDKRSPRVEGAGVAVESGRPDGARIDVESTRASRERAGIGVEGIRPNTALAGTGLVDIRADVESSRKGLERTENGDQRTENGDQDVATYSLDFPDSTKATALLSPYDPGDENPLTWAPSPSYEFQDLTRQGFLNPTLHFAAQAGIQTRMISRRAYKNMSVAERRHLRHQPAWLLQQKQTPGMGNPLEPDILNERGILGAPNILTEPGILGEQNILTNPDLNSSVDQ